VVVTPERRTILVFGRAVQTPFGTVGAADKRRSRDAASPPHHGSVIVFCSCHELSRFVVYTVFVVADYVGTRSPTTSSSSRFLAPMS